jgi:hypothetical protein
MNTKMHQHETNTLNHFIYLKTINDFFLYYISYKKINVGKNLKLWENWFIIILSIRILKFEFQGVTGLGGPSCRCNSPSRRGPSAGAFLPVRCGWWALPLPPLIGLHHMVFHLMLDLEPPGRSILCATIDERTSPLLIQPCLLLTTNQWLELVHDNLTIRLSHFSPFIQIYLRMGCYLIMVMNVLSLGT